MSPGPVNPADPRVATEVTPRDVEILSPARQREAEGAGIPAATPSGLAWWRLVLGFGVAVVSDALTLAFVWAPPVEWGIDLATAGLLFLILGRQWWLLPGLIVEAIPGLQAFPFWVLVVAAIAATGKIGGALTTRAPK